MQDSHQKRIWWKVILCPLNILFFLSHCSDAAWAFRRLLNHRKLFCKSKSLPKPITKNYVLNKIACHANELRFHYMSYTWKFGVKLYIHSQTSMVEVWEWICNFISHLIMDVIIYQSFFLKVCHRVPSIRADFKLIWNTAYLALTDRLMSVCCFDGNEILCDNCPDNTT